MKLYDSLMKLDNAESSRLRDLLEDFGKLN